MERKQRREVSEEDASFNKTPVSREKTAGPGDFTADLICHQRRYQVSFGQDFFVSFDDDNNTSACDQEGP